MSPRTHPGLTCRELVELVTEYVEGTMDPAGVSRFEEHLAGCDACTIYVEQMRETIRALGHLPPESLSPEAERRMLVAFRDWHPPG
jgi:anti-sigma factor RsiW